MRLHHVSLAAVACAGLMSLSALAGPLDKTECIAPAKPGGGFDLTCKVAQTALLERGGVELKIQSDGLEPELEAFMFRIIDKVRVAVSGSYEEFLLGCGS